ncbi:MAG: SpoIIE family protein phosphatase [Thiobacillus sp.]|nr:SpoIIE family protein phosphatase [Thiobacillus sp.]
MAAGQASRLTLANDHAGLALLGDWLRAFADAHGLPAETAQRLDLVLTEAVTNIMDYAKPGDGEGRIELTCAPGDDQIEIELADDGPPFDPAARAPARLPANLDEVEPGGLGIHLMRRYTSRFEYRREAGRNVLDMALPVDPDTIPSRPPELTDYGRIRLFRDLDDPRLGEVLASCRRLRLADGDRLIEAGQANHRLYLLLDGRMEARLSSEATEKGIAIAAGESIGEMSLLDGKPTSANVYSVGASEVLVVDEETFWQGLAPLPGVMRNLTRLIIQRLRASSERMLQTLAEQLRYEHLKKELASARDIQMGLLPHRSPLFPRHPQVDSHALLLPAKEVGGDLYDAFALDDEHILVAVGDVSGKGMPAAMFMMRTLTLLRAQVSAGPPGESFMATLNGLLNEGNDADMFVTLAIAILSVRSGRLVLFNGGHPPPMLSRAGGPFAAVVGAKGALLGIMPVVRYQSLELTLAPGDRLVLYSDGVTEAEDPQRDMLGQPGMQAALDDCPAEAPMTTLVERLAAGVHRYAAGAEQSDDITILALRYRGP